MADFKPGMLDPPELPDSLPPPPAIFLADEPIFLADPKRLLVVDAAELLPNFSLVPANVLTIRSRRARAIIPMPTKSSLVSAVVAILCPLLFV